MLPPGAKLAVLEGNPTKSGAYTMRLLMPDGYRIPPHFHAGAEHVTVVSGALMVGMGEKFVVEATRLRDRPTQERKSPRVQLAHLSVPAARPPRHPLPIAVQAQPGPSGAHTASPAT